MVNSSVNRDAVMSYLSGLVQSHARQFVGSPFEAEHSSMLRTAQAYRYAQTLSPQDFDALARGPLALVPDVILKLKAERERGTANPATEGTKSMTYGGAVGSREEPPAIGVRSPGLSHPPVPEHPTKLDDLGPYGRGSQGEQMNNRGDNSDNNLKESPSE